MQPTPGSKCQSFHQLLGPFISLYDSAGDIFDKMVATADPQFAQQLTELINSYDALSGEYANSVRDMIMHWEGKDDTPEWEWMRDKIEIQDSGRVLYNFTLSTPDNAEYFPSIIQKIKGELRVGGKISAIDHIEEIANNLLMEEASLISMARLRKIGQGLLMGDGVNENTFPQLEEVGGSLGRQSTPEGESKPRVAFPALRKVGATVNLQEFIATNFDALEEVGRNFDLGEGAELTYVPNLRTVGGKCKAARSSKLIGFPKLQTARDVEIFECENFSDLSSLETAEDISIASTKVAALDALIECGVLLAPARLSLLKKLRKAQDLHIGKTSLVELPELEEVRDLHAEHAYNLASAPKLRVVKGDLGLQFTKVTELPALEKVGRTINMAGQIAQCPQLDEINGTLTVNFHPQIPLPTDFSYYFPNVKNITTVPRVNKDAVVSNNQQFLDSIQALHEQGTVIVDGRIRYQEPLLW